MDVITSSLSKNISLQNRWDVIILGAGGAGMMCAREAGLRGRKTLLIDHAAKIGRKILISGGGRCNFTNLGASPSNYVSKNPHFVKSALSRYRSSDFVALVDSHQIAYHEKKLGQLFCDSSAQQIVDLLKKECHAAGVQMKLGCQIQNVSRMKQTSLEKDSVRFEVQTRDGVFFCNSLVVATGGLSIPKIGSSGLGYSIAKKMGLQVVETAPALDGFVFTDSESEMSELSGIAVDCVMQAGGKNFRENLLFTHRGMSGPAALQASLHWKKGDAITIDLLPGRNAFEWLSRQKEKGSRALVKNLLSEVLPARFASYFSDRYLESAVPLNQIPEAKLRLFCEKLHCWELFPSGTVGYSKAEVTRGGVDTNELSSKTLESKKIPGLYFVGEVVDVTGWLGGYNFQWAWSSGWAAGQVV